MEFEYNLTELSYHGSESHFSEIDLHFLPTFSEEAEEFLYYQKQFESMRGQLLILLDACRSGSEFTFNLKHLDQSKIADYLKLMIELEIVSKMEATGLNAIINKHQSKHDENTFFNPLRITPILIIETIAKSISICMSAIRYFISRLKKYRLDAIRLQFIASQIHNRISLSPSPLRREPPIGGVKIGGGQQQLFVMLLSYSTLNIFNKQAT